MSEVRHPNFHAVNFATQIMSAYYASLRGKYINIANAPDIRGYVTDFVATIESRVDDKAVELQEKEQ